MERKTEFLHVAVSPDNKRTLEQAALLASQPFSSWVRFRLMAVARKEIAAATRVAEAPTASPSEAPSTAGEEITNWSQLE